MKRKFLLLAFALGFSSVGLAESSLQSSSTQVDPPCAQALPTTDPNFCSSFHEVAQCHCHASGLPNNVCKDINLLYSRMMNVFGSLERACQYQHHTSTQICIDDWNCYRKGGKDSNGGLCSANGRACN